jgi:DNA replication licensing factor MCM5
VRLHQVLANGDVLTLCYRDKLRGNLLLKQHQLEVDLRHVGLFNDELAHAIQDRPSDILPLVSITSSPCQHTTNIIL